MRPVNPDEYLGGGWVDVRSGLPTDKSDERVKGRGCGFGVAVISKCGGLVQQAVKGFGNSRVGYQALANELVDLVGNELQGGVDGRPCLEQEDTRGTATPRGCLSAVLPYDPVAGDRRRFFVVRVGGDPGRGAGGKVENEDMIEPASVVHPHNAVARDHRAGLVAKVGGHRGFGGVRTGSENKDN